MQTRDLLAELAQMHRRVLALLHCIARLHQESAAQRQHIQDLAEHDLVHKYQKGGRRTCAALLEGWPWYASLTWEGTTCPACLESKEREGT